MIPKFKLPHFAQVRQHQTLGIEKNSEMYLPLQDPLLLYRFLGYENTFDGLPEEFVWLKFFSRSATRSEACLQSLLQSFLFKHSERFRKEYGLLFQARTGKCGANIIDTSETCLKCLRNPVHYY